MDDALPFIDANFNTINDAIIAPIKDQNATPDVEIKGIAPTPNIIEKVAPNDAPEEIPNIYGSLVDFEHMLAWHIHKRASPAPTIAPKITLGKRIDHITL